MPNIWGRRGGQGPLWVKGSRCPYPGHVGEPLPGAECVQILLRHPVFPDVTQKRCQEPSGWELGSGVYVTSLIGASNDDKVLDSGEASKVPTIYSDVVRRETCEDCILLCCKLGLSKGTRKLVKTACRSIKKEELAELTL